MLSLYVPVLSVLLDLKERRDVRLKCHRHRDMCENDNEELGSWVLATGVKWFNITTLTPQQPPSFFTAAFPPFLLFVTSLCSTEARACRRLQVSVIFSSLFILCHSCVLSYHAQSSRLILPELLYVNMSASTSVSGRPKPQPGAVFVTVGI